MKEKINSLLRHALTGLPAFGAGAAAYGWLTPEEGAVLDAELVKFLTALAVLAAGAAARALMWLVAKYAPALSGLLGGSNSGGGSITPVLMLVVTMAACGAGASLLSSCTPAQREAFAAMPISVGIEGQHGTYTYDHEKGIGVAVKVREAKSFKAGIEPQRREGRGGNAEACLAWDPIDRRPYRPRGMCLEDLTSFDLRSLVHDQPERGCPLQGAGPVTSAANPVRSVER